MTSNTSKSQSISMGKRLLAIVYDSLIVFFIIIISIILLQFLLISVTDVATVTIPNGENEPLGKEIPANSPLNLFFKSLWLILSFLYFAYFWTKHGQTPGMKVWKIQLISNHQTSFSWFQALRRYIFSLFGLGLLWAVFDNKNLTLQDRASQSKLVKPYTNGK